jgi:hypothetical protein
MKKLMMAAIGLMMATSMSAQYQNYSETPFTQGKAYVGASFSGTDLSYSGITDGRLGIQGKVGYFFADNLMGLAQLSYDNTVKKEGNPATTLSLSAGGRYYIQQNGLYLGASAIYKHLGKNLDDFLPSIQVGYSFFINRTVTIEPEIYYEQSFKNHKDYSTIGLRVGIGIYLFKDTFNHIR